MSDLPALLMDFLDTAEKRDRRMNHLPMGRFGEAVELAKAALFRTFPVCFPLHGINLIDLCFSVQLPVMTAAT
jgi:hypothetical protein